jgi:hypothetical protein
MLGRWFSPAPDTGQVLEMARAMEDKMAFMDLTPFMDTRLMPATIGCGVSFMVMIKQLDLERLSGAM